jgi:hypothetical protein
MGCFSNPLFVNPSNMLFFPKNIRFSKKEYEDDSYNIQDRKWHSYLEQLLINDTAEIPITTEEFMQKIIDYEDIGYYLRILGYLTKDHIAIWRSFLAGILKQNPLENLIEFHFYCIDRETAYYFKAERKHKNILFSIMIGSEDDEMYHDVSYRDEDDKECSVDEYNNSEKDETNIFAHYTFDVDKYKEVYINRMGKMNI